MLPLLSRTVQWRAAWVVAPASVLRFGPQSLVRPRQRFESGTLHRRGPWSRHAYAPLGQPRSHKARFQRRPEGPQRRNGTGEGPAKGRRHAMLRARLHQRHARERDRHRRAAGVGVGMRNRNLPGRRR